MTYKLCKTVIKNKTYISKEDMRIKLDVFLLNNRITNEQYLELKDLMDSQQENTEV